MERRMTDKKTRTKTARPPARPAMQPQKPREQVSLVYRYGAIGIEAVVAAARYSDVPRRSAEAPVAPRIDPRFLETAV